MALPVRGEVPSLAEEMMGAVSAEIGLGQEQVGVGSRVGALVGKGPKGRWQHQLQQREAIPGSPQTPLNSLTVRKATRKVRAQPPKMSLQPVRTSGGLERFICRHG